MSNSIVAKRYAVALFEIAKEKNVLDAMAEEIRVVKEVFSSNEELNAFLKQPKITLQQKQQVLSDALAGISEYITNTIMLMIERHRTDEIAHMAEDFVELCNEDKSVAEATVYTTRPITEAEREAISSVFAAKVGKKTLRIENIVDRDIIGGMKLRIGNRIFDGSVSGKLNRLERQLLS
ncbi:F0F1 ATP synthase subunit delta [Bacillus sp. AGMB 02131]|uniref:ATP synthase subunit delta n=1 Tax=Peribacillus faecalis TaxID=2772559 RepID=A0A927CZG7_9BACI|nr:F0F1 ATP synthase subunit delta [Peribacillus faecalis]MBD3109482.1 F0F1 ATP synthase subunit delta [Peribacillus faecalis]